MLTEHDIPKIIAGAKDWLDAVPEVDKYCACDHCSFCRHILEWKPREESDPR